MAGTQVTTNKYVVVTDSGIFLHVGTRLNIEENGYDQDVSHFLADKRLGQAVLQSWWLSLTKEKQKKHERPQKKCKASHQNAQHDSSNKNEGVNGCAAKSSSCPGFFCIWVLRLPI